MPRPLSVTATRTSGPLRPGAVDAVTPTHRVVPPYLTALAIRLARHERSAGASTRTGGSPSGTFTSTVTPDSAIVSCEAATASPMSVPTGTGMR